MKKHFAYLLLLSIVAGLGFAMTSCSSDDDNGGAPALPTPAYEESSAKYDITSSGSAYRSIELTASGNYIVTTTSASSYSISAQAASSVRSKIFASHKSSVSRAYFDGLYYGTYTKTGENTYNLQGFGTITVNTVGDNAYSLSVNTGSGEQTLSATKVVEDKNSDKTNALCRTWNFAKYGLQIYVNGSKKFDKTVSADNLKELYLALVNAGFEDEDWDDDWEDSDDMPKQVIFTKAGTYMVLYKDDTLDISTWAWENESKGTIRYSWDLDHMDYDYGIIHTSFKGNTLLVTEDDEWTEDGFKVRCVYHTYLTAAK